MDPLGTSCARVVEEHENRVSGPITFALARLSIMVREVGFEPTNPYGTGASGLRFQDP